MFTKRALKQIAYTGAIVIAGVALAEAFGIMAKVRAIAGRAVGTIGVTSAPVEEGMPTPIILPGYEV